MSTRSRGERAEGVVQILILLAIGSMAAAASFTHVHNVAAAHLAQHGKPITRDQLRAELRTSTNTATLLHRQVRQDIRPGLVPIGLEAFTRANGAVHIGAAE